MSSNSRDEKLLLAVKKAVALEHTQEIMQLRRKLSRAIAQRDKWRESAQRYRKNLLERQPHRFKSP